MRVAFFTECYSPVINGVVTSILTLRDALRALGHEVHVVAPGPALPDDDEMIHRVPALPFPRHPYRLARPFPRLHADFETLGIELIHCHHPFTIGRMGSEMARKLDLPRIYTAHTLYDTMVATVKSSLVRSMGGPYARGVVRRFCAHADYVIAPSMHTRDALIEGGVTGPFAVVPSGIAPYPVDPEGRGRVRQQLGLAPGDPLLIYVGRIAPEKRVDLLLRAVAALKNRDLPLGSAGFRMVLVGDGQCRHDMEALSAEIGVLDRVHFAGAQPFATIGDWYAAGDLFVMPSPAETQGIVLLEAMRGGLPCVAVGAGGVSELVTRGETGLLVPFNSEAFADAIETMLIDPDLRHRLGENGRRRAHSYSPEEMARGVLEVYSRAISGRAVGAAR